MIKTEIKDVQIDENGNIKVITDYTDDSGNLLQSGVTRYSLGILPSIEDIEALIDHDIESHAQALIARQYSKSLNVNASDKNLTAVNDLKSRVVGNKKQIATGKLHLPNKIYEVSENNIVNIIDKV